MNGILYLLNNNQGVLAVVLFVLATVISFVWWFFKKEKDTSTNIKSPHISAGRDISAGGDIIVGGQKTSVVNETQPTIVVKGAGFTFTTGLLDLLITNEGDHAASIQKITIAGQDLPTEKFSLGPRGKQIKKPFNITNYKILKEKIDNPQISIFYRDISNGKEFITKATVVQKSRAVGGFNVGKIEDNEVVNLANRNSKNPMISILEEKILKKLYKDYKNTSKRTKWKVVDAYKELGIKDGTDVSVLSESRFITKALEGTHEHFMITTEGIRYMDSQD